MDQQLLRIRTRGRGFVDVTSDVRSVVTSAGVSTGLCSVFCLHTSASLIVQENADPDVLRDLSVWMADLVVDGDARFRHRAEGPDDMSAHIRSVLTQTSLSLPVRDGELLLGTWQGIYLWEHRAAPHSRRLCVTVVGEP